MLRINSKHNFILLNNTQFFWMPFLLFSLVGCMNPNNGREEHLKHVKVFYLPKGLNPDMSIRNCNDIFAYQPVLMDTVIDDSLFLRKIEKIVKRLEKSDLTTGFDFRIKTVLFFHNGESKELCLGEGHLTVFDGTVMQDDNQLFELYDHALYDSYQNN